MIAKKTPIILALTAGALMLGGCEMMPGQEKWTPQEPAAISIEEDGTIVETVQEELGAAYYDASELQSMITSEVEAYNKENGEASVTVKEYEAADGKVKLVTEYASAQDYAAFNNTEFYYGSMINAQLAGYLFDASYKKVDNGVVKGSPVSGSEVIKRMDKEVLILRAPLEVHLPGEVLFTSTNAEVLAPDVVNATGEASDEEETEGLVLPSNAVYREADAATFAEKKAANRVYIIFE